MKRRLEIRRLREIRRRAKMVKSDVIAQVVPQKQNTK
jgi:hypothetical protein